MTEPTATSEILTLKEAAVVLRCSKAHLCNVLNGKVSGVPSIAHLVVGRRKLIRRTSLLRWMETVESSSSRP
jgi:hypothetical protein